MKKIRRYILYIIIIFTLSGCRAGKNQTVKFEKKDKAPKSLEDINSGLQELLKEVEEVESIVDRTDFEVEKVELEKAKEEEKARLENVIELKNENKDSSENESSANGKKGSQKKENSQDTKNKEEKKSPDREEKLLDKWEKINKKLEDIHDKWNNYESEGMKKGMTSDMSSRFKDSLNALTKAVEGKKIIEIYDYASQSMLNLSPMFGLYKDEIWGEINKLKYATYQFYINALKKENFNSIDLLKNYEENISKIRLKLEKNDSKIKVLDKVSLSIEDINKLSRESSIKLIRIKKDIIIKNLEELGK
ncbi:hypothetical protein [Tissierella praeacuta]|uniref:hypothetical protein n=1 Tax=Tissierella praeacuta TaxID=43131 RepID=UPI003340B615